MSQQNQSSHQAPNHINPDSKNSASTDSKDSQTTLNIPDHSPNPSNQPLNLSTMELPFAGFTGVSAQIWEQITKSFHFVCLGPYQASQQKYYYAILFQNAALLEVGYFGGLVRECFRNYPHNDILFNIILRDYKQKIIGNLSEGRNENISYLFGEAKLKIKPLFNLLEFLITNNLFEDINIQHYFLSKIIELIRDKIPNDSKSYIGDRLKEKFIERGTRFIKWLFFWGNTFFYKAELVHFIKELKKLKEDRRYSNFFYYDRVQSTFSIGFPTVYRRDKILTVDPWILKNLNNSEKIVYLSYYYIDQPPLYPSGFQIYAGLNEESPTVSDIKKNQADLKKSELKESNSVNSPSIAEIKSDILIGSFYDFHPGCELFEHKALLMECNLFLEKALKIKSSAASSLKLPFRDLTLPEFYERNYNYHQRMVLFSEMGWEKYCYRNWNEQRTARTLLHVAILTRRLDILAFVQTVYIERHQNERVIDLYSNLLSALDEEFKSALEYAVKSYPYPLSTLTRYIPLDPLNLLLRTAALWIDTEMATLIKKIQIEEKLDLESILKVMRSKEMITRDLLNYLNSDSTQNEVDEKSVPENRNNPNPNPNQNNLDSSMHAVVENSTTSPTSIVSQNYDEQKTTSTSTANNDMTFWNSQPNNSQTNSKITIENILKAAGVEDPDALMKRVNECTQEQTSTTQNLGS